jgi:hypothetical protein
MPISEESWAARFVELWASADWSALEGARGMRDLIRALVFSDWAERLLILADIPAEIRLPVADLARLSFLKFDTSLLPRAHPLRGILTAASVRTPEEVLSFLTRNTEKQDLALKLLNLARGLADIDTTPGANGLPPLWQRVVLTLGKNVTITPVLRKDESHLAGEIAALCETTGGFVSLGSDVLEPFKEIPYGAQVAVLAHFDPHGLSSLAPTVRTLKDEGFNVRVVSSYEATGDYARLWKKIVQGIWNDPETAAVVLLDLSVDSRHKERCFEFAVEANKDTKPVIWIDHHRDTLLIARKLAGYSVKVHLTSVLGCNLARRILDREVEMLAMGALSDKDTYAMWAIREWRKADKLARLDRILAGVERSLDIVTPPSKTMRKAMKEHRFDPFATVRDRIVHCDGAFLARIGELSNERTLALSDIREMTDEAAFEAPGFMDEWNAPGKASAFSESAADDASFGEWERRGRVVVFTRKPDTAGRFWYDYLERAMDLCGGDDLGRPVAPYAIACRELEGGKINLLFLTHHKAVHAPDARLFLPRKHQTTWIGHKRAFWLDIDSGEEKRLIPLVVGRITRFMDSVFPL